MGSPALSEFLLDTHVWFWYLIGSDRLPERFRQLIDSTPEACWLSPISCWELGVLAERGRVRIDVPYRDWVSQAHEHLPVREAPLNLKIALTALEVDLPHRDPADRFLAATAQVFELALVTVDERLLRAEGVRTC